MQNIKFILFIFLVNIFVVHGQIKVKTPIQKEITDTIAKNMLDAQGLRHGFWQGFYEDSKKLRYEGKFNHGQETGLFTYYANLDKKIVSATRNFTAKNNAYTIFYDDKKNVVSEGNTVNKLRTGIWKYYHKESKTVMTTENYLNDKIVNARKVYFSDGKLAEEVFYKNGLKDGLSKKYSKNGKLLEESIYVNNELQGPYKVFDESGKILIKGQFKKDKKNALWQYFENGKLVREMNADTINGYKKPKPKEKKP